MQRKYDCISLAIALACILALFGCGAPARTPTFTGAPVTVSIYPASAILTGGTEQFTATVTGSSNTAVSWSATGGTVSTNGLYTAPASAGTYSVTATSQANNTKSASATVTVTTPPVVAVSISPVSAALLTGATQQFTATVTGSSNTAVTWLATGGTVSASGLYTAPATVGTYTVTATGQSDTTKSASAVVTVTVPSSAPTLFRFAGTNGIDNGRNGPNTSVNDRIYNFDSVGPIAPTSGSLMVMMGTWPNNPTTGNGYNQTCAAPCAPTITDNNSNTLSAVFTAGSGCLDAAGFDHGIYYEQNIASGTTNVTEAHPDQISNSVWDSALFYNVATSGGTDGSSCKTVVTPTNNTAPNITGTGFSITGTNDVVFVYVEDLSLQVNYGVSSITVPSGCTLLNSNTTPALGYGIAHWSMYCIQANPGSFTPTFTVAQTTHDAFTIAAAAFASGNGGSAPSTGPGVLLSTAIAVTGSGSNYTFNVGCPSATQSIFVTDDAGSISSITDSNSNSFIGIPAYGALGSGPAEIFYSLGVSTTGMPSTYTMTLHTASTGNVDLPEVYCTTTSSLDGFTAGAGNTQVNADAIYNSVTESAGSGNCEGAASSLITCTNLPTETPATAGDLFIEVCPAGIGPILQASQPSGNIADFPVPSAVANITAGDSDDDSNGDMAGHFYQDSTSQINFGWTMEQNASSVSCLVVATR